MKSLSDEALQVLRKIHKNGLMALWYHRAPEPIYGRDWEGATEPVPKGEWNICERELWHTGEKEIRTLRSGELRIHYVNRKGWRKEEVFTVYPGGEEKRLQGVEYHPPFPTEHKMVLPAESIKRDPPYMSVTGWRDFENESGLSDWHKSGESQQNDWGHIRAKIWESDYIHKETIDRGDLYEYGVLTRYSLTDKARELI